RPVGSRNRCVGCDMETRFDHAVVAEGDLQFSVGSDKASLTYADRGPSGTAADIGAITHDDARSDLTFDDGIAQGACVVVDETLRHDSGTRSEMCAQLYAGTVGDAHARWNHVVDHPRDLADPVDSERPAGTQPRMQTGEVLDSNRPEVRP